MSFLFYWFLTLLKWSVIFAIICLPFSLLGSLWRLLKDEIEERKSARLAKAKAKAKAKEADRVQIRTTTANSAPYVAQLIQSPPLPPRSPAPTHQTVSDLNIAQALTARQATTIGELRAQIDRDATVIGKQGQEIGRLMKMGNQQAADLIEIRACAEYRAVSITNLLALNVEKLNVMNEQGEEIDSLIILAHQQAALNQTLKTASRTGAESIRDYQRLQQLRALVLRELHPDHAPAVNVDGALRSEVFKMLWPKIEGIMNEG